MMLSTYGIKKKKNVRKKNGEIVNRKRRRKKGKSREKSAQKT